MRKFLLVVIIVLLFALGYNIAVNGIEIGKFKVSSVKQIEDGSKNLKAKIEEANRLIDTEYPNKVSSIKTANNKLEEAKNEYLKYTNLSSDEEILEARTEKSYTIEFLWAKLGMHAREEGVNIKFELVPSSTGANNVDDIKFTVNGSYIAITNFIYAIENDTDLDFRIFDFKLLPYDKEILEATFKVNNIAIEGNTSTQAVGGSSMTPVGMEEVTPLGDDAATTTITKENTNSNANATTTTVTKENTNSNANATTTTKDNTSGNANANTNNNNGASTKQ